MIDCGGAKKRGEKSLGFVGSGERVVWGGSSTPPFRHQCSPMGSRSLDGGQRRAMLQKPRDVDGSHGRPMRSEPTALDLYAFHNHLNVETTNVTVRDDISPNRVCVFCTVCACIAPRTPVSTREPCISSRIAMLSLCRALRPYYGQQRWLFRK